MNRIFGIGHASRAAQHNRSLVDPSILIHPIHPLCQSFMLAESRPLPSTHDDNAFRRRASRIIKLASSSTGVTFDTSTASSSSTHDTQPR